MSPEQIQLLLKQRGRVEMPEGYTGRLLQQLHHRQRTELLRQSIWRIAVDRISTFLSEHSLSTPRYALALAALVALCLAVIALLKPVPGGPAVAKRDSTLRIDESFGQRVEAQQVSFEK